MCYANLVNILIYFVQGIFLVTSNVSLNPVLDVPKQNVRILEFNKWNILQCNVTDSPDTDYVIKWLSNGKAAELSDTVKVEFNILNVLIKDDDVDNYTCVLYRKANPNKEITRANIDVWLKPVAKLSNNDYTYTEGDLINITCDIKGRPFPIKVDWRYGKDENSPLVPIGKTDKKSRIKYEDDIEKGISSRTLIIELANITDRGIYSCTAKNEVSNYLNVTEVKTTVRIKSKLAALWPFIGICVEVIILCAIIFICDRRCNKTIPEESDTDLISDLKKLPITSKILFVNEK